jgi:hypothetical protein
LANHQTKIKINRNKTFWLPEQEDSSSEVPPNHQAIIADEAKM